MGEVGRPNGEAWTTFEGAIVGVRDDSTCAALHQVVIIAWDGSKAGVW